MNIEDLTTLEPSTPYAAPTAAATPEAHGESEAPLAQLGRFRLQRILGKGGMGQVWEAWDPNLERPVAIKRLLTTDWSARRRFVREGRLQATIAHPGICPVFEVDEHEGEPYLVMPKLDGVRLDEALEDASLEHTLDLMRQVAEAVHAAHQKGLVHRDLKPANIMVESPPDAPPRPVVLDFGIARPVGSKGLTRTGQLVGTPAFMAPEQVEGQGATLDRRVDVYALGATLYRIVTGRPPHVGTGTPLLLSIVHEEPRRLPPGDVPAEVEAIVFKCLEKDKNRRYDSARALAEDLERYLAGEPVHARPVTRWIRLGKWLRRHRIAVRVTAATAMIAVAALAWGGWSTWRSEARQEAALRFGAQVEEIEALARYSHLVPLHDTRADQARLRSRLDAIRPSLDDRDPVVRALASHALGRGHLALDELELARGHLEAAYALDPENTEIAADLGRTLSELYRDRLTHFERFGDPAKRRALGQELANRLVATFDSAGEHQEQSRRALQTPALDLLRAAQAGRDEDSVELNALMHFHEGRFGAALSLLTEASPTPSWIYERWRLEGDIRRSWAVSLFNDESFDAEAARHQLLEARAAYGQALTVAPSHAALLVDDVQTIVLMVLMNLMAPAETDRLIEAGRRRLQEARLVDPEELDAWLWAVRLELAAAAHAETLANDPTSLLKDAAALARHALDLGEPPSSLWHELGRAHEKLGRWKRAVGLDPLADFDRANKAFARVAPVDRDYAYFTSLGILRMEMAGHRGEQGLPAAELYAAAIEAYRSAAELNSRPFAALSNLGLTLFNSLDQEGVDPAPLLHRVIETFEAASRLRPDSMAPHYYLGHARLRLAYEATQDRLLLDQTTVERATVDFREAVRVQPERFETWIGLAGVLRLQAFDAFARGHELDQLLNDARTTHRRALQMAPDQPVALLDAGQTEFLSGRLALRLGQEPTQAALESESLCRRSLAVHYRANALHCVGDALRLQAEHQVAGRDFEAARGVIREAEHLFEEALRLDDEHLDAISSLARLLTLEAQRLRLTSDDPAAALARAGSLLERARAIEAGDITMYFAEAHWYLERAHWLNHRGEDFERALTEGRSTLAKLLERVPGSPEARCLGLDFSAFDGSLNPGYPDQGHHCPGPPPPHVGLSGSMTT